jgi:hypothetical protein
MHLNVAFPGWEVLEHLPITHRVHQDGVQMRMEYCHPTPAGIPRAQPSVSRDRREPRRFAGGNKERVSTVILGEG